jgi:hypothetical protein
MRLPKIMEHGQPAPGGKQEFVSTPLQTSSVRSGAEYSKPISAIAQRIVAQAPVRHSPLNLGRDHIQLRLRANARRGATQRILRPR